LCCLQQRLNPAHQNPIKESAVSHLRTSKQHPRKEINFEEFGK